MSNYGTTTMIDGPLFPLPTGASTESSNFTSYLERFFRSIKSECLSRMIFFGENSLRRAILAYLSITMPRETTRGWATSSLRLATRLDRLPERLRAGNGWEDCCSTIIVTRLDSTCRAIIGMRD